MGSYDNFFISMGVLKVIEIVSDQIKYLYLKYIYSNVASF